MISELGGDALIRPLRLFWAINLPVSLKTKILQIQNRLKMTDVDAKWIDARNLHITVKFLGDTDAALVDRISFTAEERLKKYQSFDLELSGLGFFPGVINPRVLWIGLQGKVGLLREVVEIVENLMSEYGYSREKRKFSPHLTLARLKSSKNMDKLLKTIEYEDTLVKELLVFKVLTVNLMMSDLTPSGPIYSSIFKVDLAQ